MLNYLWYGPEWKMLESHTGGPLGCVLLAWPTVVRITVESPNGINAHCSPVTSQLNGIYSKKERVSTNQHDEEEGNIVRWINHPIEVVKSLQ